MADERRRWEHLRKRAGALVTDNSYRLASHLGGLHPLARPERHGVTRTRDVPYWPGSRRPEHMLDIYHPPPPAAATPPGLRPVVLYIHGGSFRILSKDSHWMMALAYARRGYLVFNANYRLAPRHRYPAALEDVGAALAYVVRHAPALGGDPRRLVLAGESAGANLVTALTLACCYQRPELFARRVFDLDLRPAATVAACGILQVSDSDRFHRRRPLSTYLRDRLAEVGEAYLPHPHPESPSAALADPLLRLEEGHPPDRPLPPFFAPVGTRDPLLDDSRRLKQALDRLGVPCEMPVYPGEIHAFHALVWRSAARRCWRDTFAFLDQHLRAP